MNMIKRSMLDGQGWVMVADEFETPYGILIWLFVDNSRVSPLKLLCGAWSKLPMLQLDFVTE
jgi:hypothetical protein